MLWMVESASLPAAPKRRLVAAVELLGGEM